MSLEPQTSKAINLITICRRAGMLEMGFDSVKEAISAGKVRCICTATDLSAKTLKEIRFAVRNSSIPILALQESMDGLWRALGRRTGILGICDDGFAEALNGILPQNLS